MSIFKLIPLISLCLVGCAPSEESTAAGGSPSASKGAASPSEAAVAAVKAALRSEPKVKDFIYQPGEAVEWQVGVLSDGTSRNGYANYICELIDENGAMTPETRVRIADIVKVSQGSSPRSADLGTVNCSDRSIF